MLSVAKTIEETQKETKKVYFVNLLFKIYESIQPTIRTVKRNVNEVAIEKEKKILL